MQEARAISIHIILDERLGSGAEVLASLREQTEQNFQVVLLGQMDHVAEEKTPTDDGRTIWLRNYRHRGFARIHNQAIAFALSRWQQQDLSQRFIVFSHPDVVWDATALARLHAAFLQDPGLMIAGPTLLRARRVPQDDEGGYESERTNEIESQGLEMTRSRRWRERLQGKREDVSGESGAISVFGVAEPCVMVRASAFAKLKLQEEVFDPDVRSGQEIWDLMWRAAWMDCSVAVIPAAKVWHYAHRTTDVPSWLKRMRRSYGRSLMEEQLTERERSFLEAKNDDPLLRVLHAPWIMMEKAKYLGWLASHPRLWAPSFDAQKWGRLSRKREELKQKRLRTRAQLRASFR